MTLYPAVGVRRERRYIASQDDAFFVGGPLKQFRITDTT
jgi:hypothetical protein